MNQTTNASPDVNALEADAGRIAELIGRIDTTSATASPDGREALAEARRTLVAAQSEQAKAVQRARDGATGLAEAHALRHAALAAQQAAEQAQTSYLYSGIVEDAELLRHRDAVYCAGARVGALSELCSRLQQARMASGSSSKWPALRARLVDAERVTKGIHAACRDFAGQSEGEAVMLRSATTITSLADLGFALLFEGAELEGCEKRDAEIKRASRTSTTSSDRVVGVDVLRKLYTRRCRAAIEHLARLRTNGDAAALSAENARLRSELAAKAAPTKPKKAAPAEVVP